MNVQLDLEMILSNIPNAKVLFRKHSITETVSGVNNSKRIIDVSNEPDIADLFLISDILITDYSSTNLDFVILNKPFICFAPDYEEYIKERRMYYNLAVEYPFGIQTTTEEVIEIIQRIIRGEKKSEQFKAFKQKYGPYGGSATKTCIEALFSSNTKEGEKK